MALPITVPYTFGNATTAIPLSNLDSDYATVYQAVNGIGNGSVALANVAITGGTISGNTTASNVTVSSGTFTNVTLSNVTISSVSTPITAAEGGTGSSSAFTANGVAYATSTSALATGSALTFDGTNLGLGVTPSAWASPVQTALQLKGGASFASWGSYGGAYTVANAFYNGTNWKYLANNLAGLYINDSGVHAWFNAPSGTAGNAISWTQAMTLTNSGSLGIGTTSPTSTLQVNGCTTTISRVDSINSGSSLDIYTAPSYGIFVIVNCHGQTNSFYYASAMCYINGAGTVTVMSFGGSGLTIGSSGAGKITITSTYSQNYSSQVLWVGQ